MMLIMVLKRGDERLTYEGFFDHRQPREIARLMQKMFRLLKKDAYNRGWLW